MSFDRLRYELRLMGKRVILTPVLVMLGFALFALLLAYLKVAPARFLSGGLEMIVPIATGAVVGTIIMHDPALELQLTLPRRYSRTSLLRLALITASATAIALLSTLIISALHQVYLFQPQHGWGDRHSFLCRRWHGSPRCCGAWGLASASPCSCAVARRRARCWPTSGSPRYHSKITSFSATGCAPSRFSLPRWSTRQRSCHNNISRSG